MYVPPQGHAYTALLLASAMFLFAEGAQAKVVCYDRAKALQLANMYVELAKFEREHGFEYLRGRAELQNFSRESCVEIPKGVRAERTQRIPNIPSCTISSAHEYPFGEVYWFDCDE